jgi:hypothetical protein
LRHATAAGRIEDELSAASEVEEDQDRMVPKEHGAYGQMAFPLLTAIAVAGPSSGGLLIIAGVVAGFLAHEPAAVLLGSRGTRARRERRREATIWLLLCVLCGAAAAAGAWLTLVPAVRPALLVPLVPAVILAAATWRGREKSTVGEIAAAVAFSGAAVPVALAAGASVQTAAAIAIPFALLFVTTTMAVRVVILRVRRGGDLPAARATRRAALVLAGAALVSLGSLAALGVLPASLLVATTPGLLTAVIVALNPPAAIHLRTLGWTLVAVSVLTAVLVVTIA